MKVLAVVFVATAALLIEKSSAIVGGEGARAGQFPFSAAITVRRSNTQLFCGGAIWTNQWVITSAQCVSDAVLFTIQLGSQHLNANDENRVTVSTSDYFIHPEFDPTTYENDIALIKLRMPLQFNEYLRSIDLLPMFVLPDSQTVIAIGWGQTSDDVGGESEQLQFVQVTSISNDECRGFYGNQIKDNMVCIDGNFNEGICIGDIGSPLVEYYSRQLTMHAGIASFISGNGCESVDPSGYTRTYPYVSWIRNVTSGNIA